MLSFSLVPMAGPFPAFQSCTRKKGEAGGGGGGMRLHHLIIYNYKMYAGVQKLLGTCTLAVIFFSFAYLYTASTALVSAVVNKQE